MMVSRKFSLTLLILVSIVTLWFGLRPLDFFPENRVRWLTGQNGIEFYKQSVINGRGSGGVIYSDAPLDVRTQSTTFEPATIEIYLEPHGYSSSGLEHIVSFHDDYPLSPLVIAQWKNYLVIRVRDNHNPTRDTYREIDLKDGLRPNEKKLITIASGPERTEIYVNGDLACSYDVRSLIGVEHLCGYLSLGNSASGHNAWVGKLYGLAMYKSLLTSEQIRQNAASWNEKPENISAILETKPLILYDFAERTGASVQNRMGNTNHLSILSKFKALRRTVILRFWRNTVWNIPEVEDILINIIGFMPFTFCLIIFLNGNTNLSSGQTAFLAVLLSAVLSLIIEVGQLELPTRTPSSLDFLCNTLGAVLGVLVFKMIPRFQNWLYCKKLQRSR